MSFKVKNPKVVVYSIIALFFLYLTFAVDWLFIIPAVIIMFINQKELMKKSK
ncbi:hypothetical protein GF378_01430 [Candidatus Pacearchaeota archaeon]|nr:hypothetical protein [Candidatus Pacearchaeota archaeon]